MQIQSNLASTIAMAFDECPASTKDRDYIERYLARTARWLRRCKAEMERLNSLPDTINPHQMLFGINQGGILENAVPTLRRLLSWILQATLSAVFLAIRRIP